ncbi:hypothetical protein QJV44_gp16 [Serratia phage vB_SmaS_Tlacuache]|uniref:Distal tail protein n=1 Tax=Serratia phage vB_SmaS_Tlacuache TaxID=2894809 RepID=A0AAE8YW49_9CAUD|nr:hypothetical protein QJV44_gp16 [Serratia phage vB_SmaS_Tlacuache]UGO51430.1 hypothetical protein TLACUACHE_16 [Serratia phage vB_SmaS_Tlacuache]
MATLDWPVNILRPASMDWTLKDNGSIFQSKFNGSTQTVTYPGSMWKCELVFQDLDDYQSRYLETLIFQMGRSGTIRIPDFGRYGRPPVSNGPNGKPKTVGPTQEGFKLHSGWWLPHRVVLHRGDYISVQDELKMVLDDVRSDASGEAIIPIAPMLRKTPPEGAEIEVANPRGVFRLDKDENGVGRKPAFANDFNLSFVESFYT